MVDESPHLLKRRSVPKELQQAAKSFIDYYGDWLESEANVRSHHGPIVLEIITDLKEIANGNIPSNQENFMECMKNNPGYYFQAMGIEELYLHQGKDVAYVPPTAARFPVVMQQIANAYVQQVHALMIGYVTSLSVSKGTRGK